MSRISIKSPKNELIVEATSGQLVQWIHNGVGVFYQGSSIRRSGVPILFPFANPLKDDILIVSGRRIGQHGFGRDFPWQVTEQTDTSITLVLKSQDITQEMREAYPFDFEAKIKLEVADNNLIYTLQITNHGKQQMPVAPGIHPYFPIKHEFKQNLIINNLQGFDSRDIDWNKESNGYFYNFDDSVDIKFMDDRIISMQQAGLKDFENLVVWSQSLANLDHDFVCAEPFSRVTNAINDNPILIESGEVWESSICFAVETN
jgi:galactose mutarotase-like enzyme